MNVVVRAIGSRFGTSFDAAATKALLPAVIVGGRDPSLDLADGLTRSPSIVGRFHDGVAILGFNVESDGRPVRVSLQLNADSKTGPTPRLIELVGTRGESSFAVVDVTYRGVEGREPADVSLVISTENLPADGLMLVEVREAHPVLPAWASRIRPGGPVGFQLLRVRLAPEGGMGDPEARRSRSGIASSAGPQLRSGLLVVQPPPGTTTGTALSRIVLEPRLVPPWRRNRWAGSGARTIDAPAPMATVVGPATTLPARSAARTGDGARQEGLAAGRKSALAGLWLRVVALAGNVMRRGRPIVARYAGQLDRLVPDAARQVATRSTVRWLAGRKAIEARAASLTTGADIPVEVSRHRGGSMTLALRAGQDEPVLVGLQIKRGALPPVRFASGLVLWSVGPEPRRQDGRPDR